MIKRPLVLWVLAFVLGEAAAFYGMSEMTFFMKCILGMITGGCFVFFAIIRRSMLLLAVVAFFAFWGGCYNMGQYVKEIASFDADTDLISGKVIRTEEKEKSCYIYMRREKENGQVLVVSPYDIWGKLPRAGDRLCIRGEWKGWERAANDGNFDERSYYRSMGVYWKMEAQDVLEHRRRGGILENGLEGLKERLRKILSSVCDKEEAGLFGGILLGEKSGIDAQIKELYRANGLSHVLAISGLHIQILGMGIFRMLKKHMNYLLPCVLSVVFILGYGSMIHGQGATMRAVWMFLASMGGKYWGRSYDGLSALAFAFLLLSVGNPWIFSNLGFLLSASAMIGVSLVHPILSAFLKWKGKCMRAFLFSLSVQLAMLPVCASGFFEIATYGMLWNLIVIPLMSIVVGAGGAALLIGLFCLPLARIVILPGVWILRFYRMLCNSGETLPGPTVVIGAPKVWQLAAYIVLLSVVLLFCFLRIQKRGNEKELLAKKESTDIDFWWIRMGRNTGLFLLCIALVALLKVSPKRLNDTVTFLDVGQGDCALVVQDGKTFLIDGGSSSMKQVCKYRISPFLKYHGIDTLDGVFLSHSDADHINGVEEMLKDASLGSISTLYLGKVQDMNGYESVLAEAKKAGTAVRQIAKGQELRISDDAKMIVCHPDNAQMTSDNDGSLVLCYKNADFCAVFPGDLEWEGEKKVIEDWNLPDVDVLKVGHHGSKGSSSEEWLRALQPSYGIISAGKKNRYGHPHKELLERLKQYGVTWYSTKEEGQIRICCKKT